MSSVIVLDEESDNVSVSRDLTWTHVDIIGYSAAALGVLKAAVGDEKLELTGQGFKMSWLEMNFVEKDLALHNTLIALVHAKNIYDNIYPSTMFAEMWWKKKRTEKIDEEVIRILMPGVDHCKRDKDGRIDLNDREGLIAAVGAHESRSVPTNSNGSVIGVVLQLMVLDKLLFDPERDNEELQAVKLYDDASHKWTHLSASNLHRLALPDMYAVAPMAGEQDGHYVTSMPRVVDGSNLVKATLSGCRDGKTYKVEPPKIKGHSAFMTAVLVANADFGVDIMPMDMQWSHIPHEGVGIGGRVHTCLLTHVEGGGCNNVREIKCAKPRRDTTMRSHKTLPGCCCGQAVKCMWMTHTTYMQSK